MEVLSSIAFDLGLPNFQKDRIRLLRNMQQYLIKQHVKNRRVVLLIEEAQAMPLETLEEFSIS